MKNADLDISASPTTADRRTFLRTFAAGAAVPLFVGGAAAAASAESASKSTAAREASRLDTSDNAAIAETVYGKVRGYVDGGIRTFKGMPYGGDTGGQNRFMPPTKPAAWSGIRSSLSWPDCTPQYWGRAPRDERRFFSEENKHGAVSEDCLGLNVWTPGLDNAKRPVMVWFHGGGFMAGSSYEMPAYPGCSLSRRGNVVVVSVNHRLNLFGFLNLSAYGSRYAQSANVGMLDCVAALQWVHDNIANFGGDPNNVMIFGQSGGGAKVSMLTAMPAAKGLFHRASVQSGSALRQQTMDESRATAAAVLAKLNITPDNIDKIHSLPMVTLMDAIAGSRWGPAVDGVSLMQNSYDPTAPEISADVPLLVGSCLNENYNGMENPAMEGITEAQAKKMLADAMPDSDIDKIYAEFAKAWGQTRPSDIYSVAMAGVGRHNVKLQAARKAALGRAPAYMWVFAWQTKMFEGRPRAYHTAELPCVFYNTDATPIRTGGTDEARALAGVVADTWVAFARTGNPNHPGLPHWPAYDDKTKPTMIFDNTSVMRNDPEGAAIALAPTSLRPNPTAPPAAPPV